MIFAEEPFQVRGLRFAARFGDPECASQQALGNRVAFLRLWASVRERILLAGLEPFWCATSFLRDGRMFYVIYCDLISMAISATAELKIETSRGAVPERELWELATAFGRCPLLCSHMADTTPGLSLGKF